MFEYEIRNGISRKELMRMNGVNGELYSYVTDELNQAPAIRNRSKMKSNLTVARKTHWTRTGFEATNLTALSVEKV